MGDKTEDNGLSGLGDIMKGFGKLIHTVIEMTDRGVSEKNVTGDLFPDGMDKRVKGIYGFSVKMGLNDRDAEALRREPDIVTPQSDLFRSGEGITIVLEMPDVAAEDFHYSVAGSVVTIEGKGERTLYLKKVELEDIHPAETDIRVSENNGIFKMVISR